MLDTVRNWRAILKHNQTVLNKCIFFVQKFFPRTCCLCNSTDSMPDCGLCATCFALLDAPLCVCVRCGTALPQSLPACGFCLTRNWPIKELIAAGTYSWPLKEWVIALKHHQNLPLGRLMGECLSVRLKQRMATADYLIPMPLHLARLKSRGFNQASEIARVVSKKLQIPIAWDWAIRQKETLSQAELNATERRQNMHSAFAAKNISGAHVAIIDDVVTTGATSVALGETLLKAGAKEVSVWCVARVQKQ